jgi:hypothetical protein
MRAFRDGYEVVLCEGCWQPIRANEVYGFSEGDSGDGNLALHPDWFEGGEKRFPHDHVHSVNGDCVEKYNERRRNPLPFRSPAEVIASEMAITGDGVVVAVTG